jgi:hypothetical protein
MVATMMAVVMKIAVAMIERLDRRATPHTPCPDVQPPPSLAPNPTMNPALRMIAQLAGICGVGSG